MKAKRVGEEGSVRGRTGRLLCLSLICRPVVLRLLQNRTTALLGPA
jgi:hypothetical protein